MGELRGGKSAGPATYFFVTDGQKRDYLSRASSQQSARGATKNEASTVERSDGTVHALCLSP